MQLKNLWKYLPIDREAKIETKRDRSIHSVEIFSDDRHLRETAHWLCRAFEATTDGGVSRAYKAARFLGYGIAGWQPSYPETTGYIIPTMFALADYFNEPSYAEHAINMADWEIAIQLSSGAVMASVITAPPSPAVFNTGQVIFGWLASYKRTGRSDFIEAAVKAADYLLSVQNTDGSWNKGNSPYASKETTTYNTRVAWSLIEFGLTINKERYIEVGRRNIEYALTKQQSNGWFSDNCLNDPAQPLLHTIAYATRGILEAGILLNESQYITAATKTLDALYDCKRMDGGLAGRFYSDWSPAVDWDCVTGDTQTAVNWMRAYAVCEKSDYLDAAMAVIEFVKKTQNLEHKNPGIRGGVKGSFPFDGPYGQYEMLNWAAKFFCDALLMVNDQSLAKTGIRG